MFANLASLPDRRGYLGAAALALAAAAMLSLTAGPQVLPVVGTLPLLPITAGSALLGGLALLAISARGIGPSHTRPVTGRAIAGLILLGGVLAVPPILIDLATRFPEQLNLGWPGAFFFYPAIALVAEVQFHLLPFALLVWILPRRLAIWWVAAAVAVVEPLFQAAFLSGAPLQAALVLANVALISAVQLWLFVRHGFLAMIGLRLAFYLF